ncbi:MAG: RNA polymerase sigma-70 factor [Saprospiraceae bacterium]|nr:RNA polymerase sigma-70 factor [Saprospiraceae bacterium]
MIMQIETSNELLAQLRQGRKPALKIIFDAHYPEVCRAIFRLIPDQSLMEDLAQEVFMRFWEKREQIEVTGSVGAYLHRMAVNEALGHLRRKRYFQDDESHAAAFAAPAADGAEAGLLHRDLSDSLQTAMNALPPKCRTVFQLSRFEEMTYQEIADRMDISIKTVENQMGKALRIMREHLREFL